VDVHTPAQRHSNMAAIRAKNTKPEMVVRRVVHALGGRYRLHGTNLPGKPDLVFPARRKVIFVHGCFWHMHDCRYGQVAPATRTEFWQNLGGHLKTGHRSTPQNRPPRGADRDREVLLCRGLRTQVGVDFGPPAPRSAFEHVCVM